MVLAIDEDRAPRQLRRLERAERPLDVRQALVGLDRLGSPQGGALQARPDDVYAVQLRLRVDLVLLPRPADLGVGHLDGEVLIHFFAADVTPLQLWFRCDQNWCSFSIRISVWIQPEYASARSASRLKLWRHPCPSYRSRAHQQRTGQALRAVRLCSGINICPQRGGAGTPVVVPGSALTPASRRGWCRATFRNLPVRGVLV